MSDTICYTDWMQELTIFDHLRIDKSGQKSPKYYIKTPRP